MRSYRPLSVGPTATCISSTLADLPSARRSLTRTACPTTASSKHPKFACRISHFPYNEDPQLSILYEYGLGDNWRHLLIQALLKMSEAALDMLASLKPGETPNMRSTKRCADGSDGSSTPSGSISTQPTRPLPGQCEPQKAAIGSGATDQSEVI
jgi:hypothetical protein